MNIISQNETQVKTLEFVVSQAQTWNATNEALRVSREHAERNPAERSFILNGEPVIWESCPDCGRIVDTGESCPDCIPFLGEPVHAGQGWGGEADLGLEARG